MNDKKENDYPNDVEVKLENAKFLDINIDEDESLIEVQFMETL